MKLIRRWDARAVPYFEANVPQREDMWRFVIGRMAMTRARANDPNIAGWELAGKHMKLISGLDGATGMETIRLMLAEARQAGITHFTGDREMARVPILAVQDGSVENVRDACRTIMANSIGSHIDKIVRRFNIVELTRRFNAFEETVDEATMLAAGAITGPGHTAHSRAFRTFLVTLMPEIRPCYHAPKNSAQQEHLRVTSRQIQNLFAEGQSLLTLCERIGDGMLVLYPPTARQDEYVEPIGGGRR